MCGHTKGKDENIGFHRFPKDKSKLQEWLKAFSLEETDVKDSSRVCSRHFPNGNTTQLPSLYLGKCFASPKKRSSARSKRASKRQRLFVPVSSKPATDTVATAVRDTTECSTPSTSRCATPMYASIGESLLSESD